MYCLSDSIRLFVYCSWLKTKDKNWLINASFSRVKADDRLLITANKGMWFCYKHAYQNYSVIVTKRICNMLFRFALPKAVYMILCDSSKRVVVFEHLIG